MLSKLSDQELLEYQQLWEKGVGKSKRFESRKVHNTDLKFSYHVVRLLSQIEQILQEGDLDLRKNREHYKAIRRGDVSEEDIIKWAADKEIALGKLYESSKLRYKPNEEKIKELLVQCLEEHFGNLDSCIVNSDRSVSILRDIANIVDQNRGLIWNDKDNTGEET
jgi:uncharacterized protein